MSPHVTDPTKHGWNIEKWSIRVGPLLMDTRCFQVSCSRKQFASYAKEVIKWSQPVYEDDFGPFCFMKAHKNHVNIGFWRGAVMNDHENLLEGDGKRRHIE